MRHRQGKPEGRKEIKMMNKAQREYAEAKAMHDTVLEAIDKVERDFIKRNEIMDENGKLVDNLFLIDNDELFDIYTDKFDNLLDAMGLQQTRIDTLEILKDAEEELIKFGLNLVPKKERDILSRNRYLPSIRERLIDLAFRLDTSTI